MIFRHFKRFSEEIFNSYSSAILPLDCDHVLCQEAMANPQCINIPGDHVDAHYVKKLVVRRNSDMDWVIECRRFLKVVLPEVVGGTPGRRTVDAADRGRLTSEAAGSEASVKIKIAKVTGETEFLF